MKRSARAKCTSPGTARNRITTISGQPRELQLSDDAAMVHITSNETIEGVQFATEPAVGDAPWSAMLPPTSSRVRSPSERYGIIYACAQKNVGPAGVTVVVIREDLLGAEPGFAARLPELRQACQEQLDVEHAAHVRRLHGRIGRQVVAGTTLVAWRRWPQSTRQKAQIAVSGD